MKHTNSILGLTVAMLVLGMATTENVFAQGAAPGATPPPGADGVPPVLGGAGGGQPGTLAPIPAPVDPAKPGLPPSPGGIPGAPGTGIGGSDATKGPATTPRPVVPHPAPVPVLPVPGFSLPPPVKPPLSMVPGRGHDASSGPMRGAAPVPGMPGGEGRNTFGAIHDLPAGSIEVAKAQLVGDLNQDPQASASRYASIVANFDAQRQSAAMAVYGLGEAYRKMGRTAEARVQYARILREFVDFPELAHLSQKQLSSTNGASDLDLGGGAFGGGRTENVEEERALLREELDLLQKELGRMQDRITAGVEPHSNGLQLQRDILRLKQQLARLPRATPPTVTVPRPAVGVSFESQDHDHDDNAGAPPRTESNPQR